MSIPDHIKTNFNTLLRAARDDRLALMECNEKSTGEHRYVLCAVNVEGGAYQMVPFGHLNEGNPFEAYTPILSEAARADS